MSDEIVTSLPKPEPLKVDERGLYITPTQAEVIRVAKTLMATGAVPSSFRAPEQVAVAIQALKSLGLNPYASIRQTGFINGSMTLYGDLPLAIARATGTLKEFEEFPFCIGEDGKYERQCYANSNCHLETYGFVCRLTRTNQMTHEVVFTQVHAKQAGLWQKTPTWRGYPARMLQMRARSQAIKDVFSDALAGVAIQEYDLEGVVDGPPPKPVRAKLVPAPKPQLKPAAAAKQTEPEDEEELNALLEDETNTPDTPDTEETESCPPPTPSSETSQSSPPESPTPRRGPPPSPTGRALKDRLTARRPKSS